MTEIEIRNALVKGLNEYLDGIEVYRSGQVSEEQPFPYIIYTVTATGGNGNTMGHFSACRKGDDAEEIREEQKSMTISLTVCSQNRTDREGKHIQGEDEAQEIAERAHGWFSHVGYDYFVKCGIVIADVMEVRGRNTLMGHEEANRKGFDVICNYISEERRDISTVSRAIAKRKKEEKDERRSGISKGG